MIEVVLCSPPNVYSPDLRGVFLFAILFFCVVAFASRYVYHRLNISMSTVDVRCLILVHIKRGTPFHPAGCTRRRPCGVVVLGRIDPTFGWFLGDKCDVWTLCFIAGAERKEREGLVRMSNVAWLRFLS